MSTEPLPAPVRRVGELATSGYLQRPKTLGPVQCGPLDALEASVDARCEPLDTPGPQPEAVVDQPYPSLGPLNIYPRHSGPSLSKDILLPSLPRAPALLPPSLSVEPEPSFLHSPPLDLIPHSLAEPKPNTRAPPSCRL